MVKFDKSTLSFFSKQIWWSLTFYTNQFTFVASHFLDEIQNFYILSWILGLSSDGPKIVGQKKEKKKSGPLPKTFNPWSFMSKKKFCEPQGTESLWFCIFLEKRLHASHKKLKKRVEKIVKCKKKWSPNFHTKKWLKIIF